MKKSRLQFISITLLCTLFLFVFSAPAIVTAAENTTPSGINLEMLEDEINRYMEEHIGVSSPGAAVAVIKNGEVIFSNAYGMADLENKIPVNTDTVFEYGSISKMFVWISIMQLVEQGKLDLDTNIREYLPDDFNQKWKTSYDITMRNIINHSSGYGEYIFDAALTESSKEIDLADAILITHPYQYYKPGTASAYSNYATTLAAYVVECISGQEFFQYQKENIFDRIGMNQTAGHPFWQDNISILEKKAQGYAGNGKGNFRNTGWSNVAQYPVGSVNGTVGDLAKLLIALMPENDSNSPLFENPNTLPTLLSPSYTENTSGTAHGFLEFKSAASPAFGHGGNTVSFTAQSVFVPEEQFGLIVLTNAGKEFAITYGLHDLLIGNKDITQVNPTQEMPNAYDLTGSYVSMRRCEKSIMEFIYYLPMSMTNVQALDENTIKVQMNILSGHYIQTAPYTFEILDDSDFAMKIVYSKLVFKMENGVPVQILIGNGLDLSSFPSHRSPANLILSVVVLIASILFFLIAPIILIILVFKRKKKNITAHICFTHMQTFLTLCGTALLLNNAISILLLMINPMIRYSQLIPFGIINYLIVFISVATAIFGSIKIWKQANIAQKLCFISTGAILVSFILLLVNWNAFLLYF